MTDMLVLVLLTLGAGYVLLFGALTVGAALAVIR